MPIRVLTIVDQAGAAGGGERVAVDLATGLHRDRFDSLLCVTRPSDPETLAEIRRGGTLVIELNRRSRLSLLPWLRLVRVLRRSHVDVLHSHKFGSNAWAAIVARLARVPVFVAHEHSWSFANNRLRSTVNRRLIASRAAAIVAVSSADRERMISLERIAPGRVVVCPNGVRDTPAAPAAALRDELDLPPGATVVGIVAGLRPEKRVDLLLHAVARLRPRHPDLVALVVGDGPERPQLEALAAELGIFAAVRFLGRREDARSMIRLFDAAVLTSEREGAPLALLEYMAAGRPIVATRVGGVPELARDGLEALLVPPGDDRALAAALERLLVDDELRTRLGRGAAARQADEFRLAGTVARIEALYEELLAA